MLEALLSERHCQWDGKDISERKRSAETCSDNCRFRRWQRRHPGNRARREVVPLYNGTRRSSAANSRPSKTRYAVVQAHDTVAEILAFDSGKGKRAVERAFGILDRPDLEAVATRHLPAAIAGGA